VLKTKGAVDKISKMWWARWRAKNNTSRLQKLAPGGSSSTAEEYARDMAGDPLLHRWTALTAAQWSTARAMTPRSMDHLLSMTALAFAIHSVHLTTTSA